MKPDFNSYYQSTLLPVLEQLEAKRRGLVKNKIRLIVITALVCIGCLLASGGIAGIIVLALGFVLYLYAFNRKDGELIQVYKKEVLGKMVTDYLDGINYEPYIGLTEDKFIAIDLFNHTPDRYHSEDFFSGSKDKTRYSFSEVHAEYKTEHLVHNSNGTTSTRTEWHTIFSGTMFCVDFNKHFNDATLIKQDSFKLFGDGSRIRMEDPAFENTFDVYSDNEQEARYLITPAFMERFANINNQFDRNICAAFHAGELVIALSDTGDNFEPNQWSSLLDAEKIKEELNRIHEFLSIIDTLDLNTRIWSKA